MDQECETGIIGLGGVVTPAVQVKPAAREVPDVPAARGLTGIVVFPRVQNGSLPEVVVIPIVRLVYVVWGKPVASEELMIPDVQGLQIKLYFFYKDICYDSFLVVTCFFPTH